MFWNRATRVLALALVCAPFSSPATYPTVRAQTAADAGTELAQGRSVEGELRGGESRTFWAQLEPGLAYELLIEQRSLYLRVDIKAPSGTPLVSGAGHSARYVTSMPLTLVPTESGRHVLHVAPFLPDAPPGHFTIRLAPSRPATDGDRRRFAAQRLLVEGLVLKATPGLPSRAPVIAKGEEALAAAEAAGDRRGVAEALLLIAELWFLGGDLKKSAEFNERAIPIVRELGLRDLDGRLNMALGVVYRGMDELEKARTHLLAARDAFREIGDRAGEAIVLISLGVAAGRTGDQSQALRHYEEALVACRAVGDVNVEITVLGNISVAHAELGNASESVRYLEEAWQKSGRVPGRQVYVLHKLSDNYRHVGEFPNAIDAATRGLELARKGGDRRAEARLLFSLGSAYRTLGDCERALPFFAEAIPILEETKNVDFLPEVLLEIASCHSATGKNEKVLEQVDLVAARMKDDARSGFGFRGSVLRAEALCRLGRDAEALAAADAAVATLRPRSHWYLWPALMTRAEVHERAGRRDAQIADLREAYEFAASGLSRGGRQQLPLDTLGQLIVAEVEAGKLEPARADVERYLSLEASTPATRIGPGLAALPRNAQARERTRRVVRSLMQLDRRWPASGYAAHAWRLAERERTRGLVEALDVAGVDLTEGLEPALAAQEREVRRTLLGKLDLVARLADAKAPAERIATVEREADEARARYREIQLRIAAAHPVYAALKGDEPLTLDRLRRDMLDPGVVLLEYMLGDAASYVWVVTRDGISAHDIGPRAPIEAAAERARTLLMARACTPKNEDPGETVARVRKADAETPAALAELGRLVLGPVASKLKGRQVVVVPDGILAVVPFGALPTGGKTAAPLVATHDVVSLPSAAALVAMRRVQRAPASKTVALVADPVFSEGDERLAKAKKPADSAPVGVPDAEIAERSWRGLGGCSGRGGLDRLPGTRAEASAIASMVAPAERLEAFDFDANLELVRSGRLADYRIVHFATHGYVPPGKPELTGLVLSLYGPDGAPREGFLGLDGLYNLRLPAELVVLSGCETGLGKEVVGEGLVGVAQGFMHAGARRVVASSWAVDDAATAEFMREFYRSMLVGKRTPAAALRSAQLSLMRSKRWGAPFYWASFTLYGEWR